VQLEHIIHCSKNCATYNESDHDIYILFEKLNNVSDKFNDMYVCLVKRENTCCSRTFNKIICPIESNNIYIHA